MGLCRVTLDLSIFCMNWTRSWPASNEASLGRASHRYYGGHVFKSQWSLRFSFFSGLSLELLKLLHNCEDHFHYWSLLCCSVYKVAFHNIFFLKMLTELKINLYLYYYGYASNVHSSTSYQVCDTKIRKSSNQKRLRQNSLNNDVLMAVAKMYMPNNMCWLQMDADYEEQIQSQEMDTASSGRKRKRMSRFAQALHRKKPTFNPGEV